MTDAMPALDCWKPIVKNTWPTNANNPLPNSAIMRLGLLGMEKFCPPLSALTPTHHATAYQHEGDDWTQEDDDNRVGQHHLRHRVELDADPERAEEAAPEQHVAVRGRHRQLHVPAVDQRQVQQPSHGRAPQHRLVGRHLATRILDAHTHEAQVEGGEGDVT
ncbi:unnamed protein product [Phytophthora lilii]|uniref:Unnamed protein product n=1 Tax=Phytophthora lilii TaxID=2077276 RepID=A0A9W6TUV0_9STRA|nr:unnamed protein product [Phytophthora lilii]